MPAAGVVDTKGKDGEPQAIDVILEREKPQPWGPGMKKLYLYFLFCFWGSAMNGFDGSLFGSLYYLPSFTTGFWGFDETSDKMVLLINLYTFGGLIGALVAGPACDQWGRRVGMALGSVIVIVGTIMCAAPPDPNYGVFGTGRFLCGFGVTIASSACPAWVIEMAHPAYRGWIGGIYNTFWFVGNIIATWIAYGTQPLEGTASWRIPFYTQLIPSALVLVGAFLMPESARWLVANGKAEQARSILINLHADGNESSELVALEMEEMTASISTSGSDKRFWDYSGLFATGSGRYRTLMVFFIAFFGQMSGSNMFSYFGATIYKAAGWEDNHTIQLFNGIQTVISFFVSQIGAWGVNRLGRRTLIIPGTAIFVIWLALLAAASKIVSDDPTQKGWGAAAVAAAFLFQMTNALTWTPMQALYAVECLETSSRAKGMGFNGLVVQAALAINNYIIPKGVTALGWKFYIIYIAWDLFETFLMWALLVETKGFTLEELEEIFSAPNPKKASLARKAELARAAGEA
ncbi:hypothetical protein HDV00_007914 [Rhizophlyctis rosea]|nr:hypothetical protein HDV00_007914 [Rhizophlyctis rosea]